MELEDLIKKVILMDLKAETKKHGIPVASRTKIGIEKDLHRELLKSWQISEKYDRKRNRDEF